MCGIFGIVKKHETALGPVLTEAGRRLSYRGYDSVGCATIHDNGTIDLRKDAGKEDVPLSVSGINEVTCRGGHAIMFGEKDSRLSANAQTVIEIPSAPAEINALLTVLLLQLLSYKLSLARGFDPDFPRNLSKTLTVD